MLRLRLVAALAGALVAGLAVATIASARELDDDSANPGTDYAFGVGSYGPACVTTHTGPFCTPANFTFRLLALSRGHGHRAWGLFERRNNVNGVTFAGPVTCMNVEGNRASIGGVVTRTPATAPGIGVGVGDPYLVYVVDNGPPGGAAPDQISPFAVLPAGDPDLPLMPARFPRVCPSPESIYGYFALASGDVTVAAGGVGSD